LYGNSIIVDKTYANQYPLPYVDTYVCLIPEREVKVNTVHIFMAFT